MNNKQKPLLELLKDMALLAAKSEFYSKRLKSLNLDINNISSLEEFSKLPFITSPDMREHSKTFPAIPREEIAALFASGGTTGKPKIMYWTEEGLDESAKYVGLHIDRFFNIRGKLCILIVPGDNLAIVGTIMRRAFYSVGGMTAMMGLMSNHDQKKELIDVMKEENPYFMMGNPARLVSFLNDCKAEGVDPKSFGLKYIMSTSEVLQAKLKRFLEESYGAKIIQQAGMTEVSGIGIECSEFDGMHILEDAVYVEVVDPVSGKPIKEGVGEVVVSNLVNTAYPLVRYQTEDLARITYLPCRCGLTTPRLWYKCRTSESIDIEGQKIYAYQIDEVLNTMPHLSSHFSLKVSHVNGLNNILIQVESDSKEHTKINETQVKDSLNKAIPHLSDAEKAGKISIDIKLIKIETLPRTPRGKVSNRIVDERVWYKQQAPQPDGQRGEIF